MRRMILVVLTLASLYCALGEEAAAQSGNQCPLRWFITGYYSIWDATLYPPIPPEAFNCSSFNFTVYCQLPPLCPPPGAPPETRCGASCSKGGRPIDLATGNTYIEQTDIRLAGLGGGLTLRRIWNSMWPPTQSALQIGMFGPNWRSTYEERIFLGSDHYMKYARSDGSFWSFVYNGGVHVAVAPANVAAQLIEGSTYLTLAFQNGEQRLFDNNSGKLIAIVDRNGNTTSLTYDSGGRLVTVTDPGSRHLYFGYGSGVALVTGVTSDFGPSVSYSYDSQGRLSQVTEPDGSTLSFQYDSNSFISAVLDSNGKVLESHTYDSSGRGLTSSRANGVEFITVSYR